jgi:hypothetical protein
MDPDDPYTNFIYEERAGEGSYVYVIEMGINVNVLDVSVY